MKRNRRLTTVRRDERGRFISHAQPISMVERGRLGGRATVKRHGSEHMARIGRLGFLGLARRLGYAGGSRLGAIQLLYSMGRLRYTSKEVAQQVESQAFFERFMNEMFSKLEIHSS